MCFKNWFELRILLQFSFATLQTNTEGRRFKMAHGYQLTCRFWSRVTNIFLPVIFYDYGMNMIVVLMMHLYGWNWCNARGKVVPAHAMIVFRGNGGITLLTLDGTGGEGSASCLGCSAPIRIGRLACEDFLTNVRVAQNESWRLNVHIFVQFVVYFFNWIWCGS